MNEPAPPLPAMVEALLAHEELDRLFDELLEHTRILSVRVKAGPRVQVGEASLTLREARRDFESGAMRSLQVQYQYDGHVWSDTLMRGPDGVRLVRCRHEGGAATE